MSRGECPNLRRCEVLLVVQKRQHLDPFLNTLVSATENDLGGRTAVSVFVDSERGAAGGGGGDCNNAYRGVPFRVGRANPVSAIKRLGEAARTSRYLSRAAHYSRTELCSRDARPSYVR